MLFLLAFMALAGPGLANDAQKVIPMPFSKRFGARADTRLHRRAKVLNEPLANDQYLYLANVTVGTPPQQVSLQLDTGSSDVWMTASGAQYCLEQDGNCYGGTFDSHNSSTYNPLTHPVFNISYLDGTYSVGNYFTDTLAVAGASLTDLQMGLATDTTIGTGIMGVGYAIDEAVCVSTDGCLTYPSIIDQMVAQDKIQRRAYSLWLDDLESNTGNILFGGIDSAKYLPPLIALPVQNDSATNTISSFTVAWSNLTLSTPEGQIAGLWPDQLVVPAVLDSGTTLMLLPPSIADPMLHQFGAILSDELQTFIAACSLTKSTALFEFQFGGSSGPRIQVPISELLLPIPTGDGQPYTLNDVEYCEMGILRAAEGEPILLGDTFLRSAYAVYDLDNNVIALAQANFNPSNSSIQEIPSGNGAIPGVTITASGVSVPQSASDIPNIGITTAGSGVASATDIFSSATETPLTRYTAVNSFAPTNVDAGAQATAAPSTSRGAAASLTPSTMFKFEALSFWALTTFSLFVGCAMMLL